MKYKIIAIALVAALCCLPGCSSKVPSNLGMHDGRFTPCPADADNCISSQAADEKHHVQPLKVNDNADKVMVDLANAIESMFGAKVVAIDGNYLHAEYTSRLFRLVDDLECYYDEDKNVIEVRSSSRNGLADMKTNRDRIEQLRALFEKMD